MNAFARIRALSLTLLLALAGGLAGTPAVAQSPAYVKLAAGDMSGSQPIYLGINKSVVVDLPRQAGDVLVSNPKVADAVLRTSTRLYLIGVQLGQASVFLFDSSGGQIASFDIYVEADLSALNQLLAEAITDGYVRAEAIQGSIVLRGQVNSPADASRAVELATRLIPVAVTSTSSATSQPGGGASSTSQTLSPDGGPGIVNLINIVGEDQVALKVTIAEVQREVTKQLGINIGANYTGDDFSTGTAIAGAAGGISPLVNSGGGQIGVTASSGSFSISAILQALDETNMIRTLAEPTLTAVSGETANFLAGGQFGYRVLQSSSGTLAYSTAFQPFGVQLAFTPVVLSSGRISIKVATSVSDISGVTDGIPTLSTRSVETTVEQPSGGSFVIGGLLQQNTANTVSGFPGLRSLPIIGSLFSSKSYIDRQTELVVIVTPYLVKPTAPAALASPEKNLAAASDAESYFLNRVNKVYGHESQANGAQVGFTFD